MTHPACKLSLIALACAALTACGGGGDDATPATTGTSTTETTGTTTGNTTTGNTTTGTTGSTGTTTGTGTSTGTTTPVAATDISLANFKDVAGLAASSADMVVNLVNLPEDLAAQTASAKVPRAAAASLLFGAVQRASALERAQAVSSTGNPLACSSGSSTIEVNDANGNDVRDAGDIVTITDTNCLRDGETSTGQMSMTLNATTTGIVAEDSASFTVDVNISATNYKVDFGDGTSVQINGKARFQGYRTAYHTGRDELTVDTWTQAVTDADGTQSASLMGYSGVINYTPTQYTVTINGDVSSSWLNNVRYTVSTQTPFALAYDADYPRSGLAKVTAASGNSVSVQALSASQASLSPDLNADGTADANQTVTAAWSDLY